MSVGRRSLVHCILPKLKPNALAMPIASVVLPSPGRSSMRRCPPEKKEMRDNRKDASFPCRYGPRESVMISNLFRIFSVARFLCCTNQPSECSLLNLSYSSTIYPRKAVTNVLIKGVKGKAGHLSEIHLTHLSSSNFCHP